LQAFATFPSAGLLLSRFGTTRLPISMGSSSMSLRFSDRGAGALKASGESLLQQRFS
jgi:hypothetical protein